MDLVFGEALPSYHFLREKGLFGSQCWSDPVGHSGEDMAAGREGTVVGAGGWLLTLYPQSKCEQEEGPGHKARRSAPVTHFLP